MTGNLNKPSMKKLLFVLAFTFIGQQAFSQMYIVSIATYTIGGCSNSSPEERTLTTVTPAGIETHTCIPGNIVSGALISLNQELNSIISQGYKLIETNNGYSDQNGAINRYSLNFGTSYYFAIPWSASGLEEVAMTLNSLSISPNPANTFVDISLDYSLKGESEVVFISEAGYISHKQSIGNISKNEKYNIDISKIPAGKYLATIVNGKTYTTPQKLIVL